MFGKGTFKWGGCLIGKQEVIMVLLIIGAVMTLYMGDVKIRRNGDVLDPVLNMELSEGDTVITGSGAKAEIMEKDSSVIVLNENTTFTIVEERTRRRFFLSWGSIWAKVKKLAGWNFQIESPATVAGVRGTEFFVCFTDDSSQVGVVEGKVDVLDKKEGRHYLLDKMKQYKRVKKRVIIRKLKKINRWAEWKKKDLDHVIKLGERGNLQATIIAEALSKRINSPDALQRIKALRTEQNRGTEGKLMRIVLRIRALEADVSLMERKVRRIGSGMGRLKNLIGSGKFKLARTIASELENRISASIPETFEIEAKAKRISQDLRLLLKELKSIDDPKVKARVKKEIMKNIKRVSVARARIRSQRKRLERFRNLLNKLKKGIKP